MDFEKLYEDYWMAHRSDEEAITPIAFAKHCVNLYKIIVEDEANGKSKEIPPSES